MRRGILVLNREELLELAKYINYEKFNIALESLSAKNKILINDEELENILDEIGKPDTNKILNIVIKKISNRLLSLRDR